MLYNYNYGMLENNMLLYAPKNIQYDNSWYIPAPKDILLKAGYFPIQHTPYPQDGKYYANHWELVKKKIVEVWEEIPAPTDSRTPTQKREEQYKTKYCVVFPENSDDLITIDDGVKLVYEYQCENTDRAIALVNYLKQQITEQKAIIREQYPDEEQ